MLNKIIAYFLSNKLISMLLLLVLIGWGIISSPFDWNLKFLPSDPVAVDAIPDIGENQQIVFTKWVGRSPQDIEDQISYPLTSQLLGVPGVKSIRSSSIFGLSSIYIIFKDDIDFYWSRSRVLEKMSSLQPDLLPDQVKPSLGPDATALGQIYWYTLEGQDKNGAPTGGWDLDQIRSIQDFYVKYGLNAVEGVSEVASIGGFVKEYQVDVNPDALKAYNIPLQKVMDAVRKSNKDIGAKTIEINQVEYIIRGLGYVKTIEDIEKAVVAVKNNTPIRISDIARVKLGPANRRGVLDKNGQEAVGGVVVARYGANPLKVINQLKEKIKTLSSGLPSKTLADGTVSQLTIVPFYDRSILIHETLGTLEEALWLEILISILVVIVMVYHLRASILISSLLPVCVLSVFIAMRHFGVDANIVALSGIAIAIGTLVDLGIIMSENIINHQREAPPKQSLYTTVYKACSEVAPAIVTAVTTTIISFIPVFTLEASEGKLFTPLAYTKTFALTSALIVALCILPTLAYWLLGFRYSRKKWNNWIHLSSILLGIVSYFLIAHIVGVTLIFIGTLFFVKQWVEKKGFKLNGVIKFLFKHYLLIIITWSVCWLLTSYWLPLGAQRSIYINFLFVALLLGSILGLFTLLEYYYAHILAWALKYKWRFLMIPCLILFLGLLSWVGFNTTFSFVAKGFDKLDYNVRTSWLWSSASNHFPGVGKEFMPSLDEGSFLLMPTSMPHAGMEYNQKTLAYLDKTITKIPEVDLTIGKLGRIESALDPAPISMYENIINYKPEYITNAKGYNKRFKVNRDGDFVTYDGKTFNQEEALEKHLPPSQLIEDEDGKYFRNWRKHIISPNDIWNEIISVVHVPGLTSAPKLQPIETRLIMLQTGMRSPMGIKVYGPDLASIQDFGVKLETILQQVPSIKKASVFADRTIAKPYIHLVIKRDEIARHGLNVDDIQNTIQATIGGMKLGLTVEGRERYAIRVRYPRELRDNPGSLSNILVSTPTGEQIPLSQLVDIVYHRGPQMIKSEDNFLVGYVLFDKKDDWAEVSVVNQAQSIIEDKINQGELIVPKGINYTFSGTYENQVRAENRLMIIMPVVLLMIFLILYMQFRSVSTSLLIFTGIALAFSGGFIMIWLYGESWFANISLWDKNLRDIFQMHTIKLSVAVWVGFIALFGIAADDGVLIATYLDQSFKLLKPKTVNDIRKATLKAGKRRIKPALMTIATTVIALLPVLSSDGRGSSIMVPMAIPILGGMVFAMFSVFVVPVLYALIKERKFNRNKPLIAK